MNSNSNNFEGFELDAERKILRRGGEIVPLPPKAVELLVVLIKNRGEVVSKNELLETVWQGTFVEESVLSNNIYILRKTLSELGAGKSLIQTVPRRGYRFNPEQKNDSEMILERHVFEQTVIEEAVEIKIDRGENDSPIAASPAPQIRGEREIARRINHRPHLLAACLIVVLLAASGFAVWRFAAPRAEAGLEKINTIAVLPLKPLAANESDKILSLGLADALIANLGSSQKLVVRPVSSITKYAEGDYDALAVGRRLRADAVLEGSFQRAENRLRVRVKLLRVADGKQIWAGTFDETEQDVFKLQDKISLEAARALAETVNQARRDFVFKRYTENVEAYQAYQRGRYLFFRRGSKPENLEKAVAEFERALQLDKNYAIAYAGLADAEARIANNSDGEKRREFYEKAKSNALKALALDSNLAEAHAAIGWINRIYDWDWASAEKHLRRAVELAPNAAFHHRLYAYLLVTLGRTEEAVEYNRRAKQLDPAESDAWTLFCDRRFQESADEYAAQLRLEDSPETRRGLAMALSELGKQREAIETIEQIPTETRDDYALQIVLTIALFRAGERAEAEKLLKILEVGAAQGAGRAVRLASVYAVIGEKEKALAALEKAVETRDDRLMWIKSSALLDNLRDEPRFQAILRRMNL